MSPEVVSERRSRGSPASGVLLSVRRARPQGVSGGRGSENHPGDPAPTRPNRGHRQACYGLECQRSVTASIGGGLGVLTSAVGSSRTRAATGGGGGRRHLFGSRYREGDDVQLVLPARRAGAAELPDRRGGGQLVVGVGPGRSCAGGDRGLRRAQIDDDVFDRIAARMSYVSGDFGGAATCVRVKSAIRETRWPVFYCEIPPFVFGPVIKGRTEAGFTNEGRVVVEKPFGHDLASPARGRRRSTSASPRAESDGGQARSVDRYPDARRGTREETCESEQVTVDVKVAGERGEGPAPYEVLFHAALVGDSKPLTPGRGSNGAGG